MAAFCLLDISWKDIFLLGVLFYMKIPFVFSVSVFCPQIFTVKIIFKARIWSNLCNFYSKVIFFHYLSKIFLLLLLFFAKFELLMLHNKYCENFRKTEQAELVENLPPSYLHYGFLHNLPSFSLWKKSENISLKTND